MKEQPLIIRQAKPNVLRSMVLQLRVRQWTKNLLVLASGVFSGRLLFGDALWQVTVAFLSFSFAASAIYILNDILDAEKDKLHPDKRNRPIASGALGVPVAIGLALLLLVSAAAISLTVSPLLAAVILAYFALNLWYCFTLKHVVIADVMVIAIGFVLRALAGVVAVNGEMTPWFLLCTLLLALFLALGKRRHELQLFEGDEEKQRAVLKFYSMKLLDHLITIVTGLTIMCYSLYAATATDNQYLMFTIPVVIYGVFRYMYLIHMESGGGKPEELLLTDKHIVLTVVIFGIAVLAIRSFL